MSDRKVRFSVTAMLAASLVHGGTPAQRLDWQIETVDTQGTVGPCTSLVLDWAGRPHIAYYDETNTALKHAHRGDAGWDIETVDNDGNMGRHCAVAMTGAGGLHVAYCEWGHVIFDPPYIVDGPVGLRHASNEGGAWLCETAGGGGGWATIDLDGTGLPHMASTLYASVPGTHGIAPYAVQYVWWDGSGWQRETVESGLGFGQQPSLSLDAAGLASLSYLTTGVRYARRDPTGWNCETVDNAGGMPSLRCDALSRPRLSYAGGADGPLMYAERALSGWNVESAAETRGWTHSSLALDAAGNPHLAYYDESTLDLRYCHKGDTGWRIEVVESGGDVGRGVSLALDAWGLPHVSYHDAVNGDLKYAFILGLPDIEVDPISLTAEVVVGGSGTTTFQITNTGTGTLAVYAIEDDAAWLSETPSAFTLSPGEVQTVAVSIDATDLGADTYHQSIEISSSDPDQPELTIPIHVTVTALPEPNIEVTPASLEMDVPLGQTAQAMLSVGNVGTATLIVGPIIDDVEWLSETPMNFSLYPGENQAVTVTFDGTGLPPGSFSAAITIESNDPDEPVVTVPVTGALGAERSAQTTVISLWAAPNPFTRATVIGFTLDRPAAVRLTVHDALGRMVGVAASGTFQAGSHEIPWDPIRLREGVMDPGVYVLQLQAGGRSQSSCVVRVP